MRWRLFNSALLTRPLPVRFVPPVRAPVPEDLFAEPVLPAEFVLFADPLCFVDPDLLAEPVFLEFLSVAIIFPF